MVNEQTIVRDAVALLQEYTGLQIDIHPEITADARGFNCSVTIAGIRFLATVKTTISLGNKNFANASYVKTKAKMPALIIAGWIPKVIAKEYAHAGINYLDKAGNCHISEGNLKIIIEGKKIEKAAANYQSRAFQEAGIRIIFQLLTDPAALTFPYRILAQRVGLSLGSVGSVMRELFTLNFVLETGKRRVLNNTSHLLERWVTAYHDVLRPRLIMKRLKFTQPEQFYDWERLPLQTAGDTILWGGEPGASLLTNYLNPEKFTLYTDGTWQDVVRELRLLPSENGPIEVLQIFWKEELLNRQQPVVSPLLVYADLMGSTIGRNIETANIIRENELSRLLENI